MIHFYIVCETKFSQKNELLVDLLKSKCKSETLSDVENRI